MISKCPYVNYGYFYIAKHLIDKMKVIYFLYCQIEKVVLKKSEMLCSGILK